jgi:radical SAM superfamily enzyme YgiQ (UPF0313 family)
MNVLLVYPRYPDTFWSFKHVLKYIKKKAAFPPLGLLTVASMLPAEWNKKLVDMNVEALEDSVLDWADMLLIGGMLIQKKGALETISRAKALGKVVVAGGPLFTDYQTFEDVDHFVLNEAEVTLPLFLKDLAAGTPMHVYSSKQKPDLSSTPIPMWSLIDLKKYAAMAVQYSRGCPFDCDFCDIVVMNGRVPRLKGSAQFISELDSLRLAGWHDTVFIVDDNFIGNKASVKKMLPSLIRWQEKYGYPFRFLTEASINLSMDDELMSLMSKANFSKVFLGLETPAESGLKECGKLQNVSVDVVEAVKKIHRNGMQVMGGFIVGFDSDTEGIFEAQIRFIQKIGVVTAMVGVLNAMPHTRLWHRLQSQGRLITESNGHNTAGMVNFEPVMGKSMLVDGYKKIIQAIYSRKNYYRRVNVFISSYRPTVKNRFSAADFHALVRSIWRIGIVSRSRFLYWKLFFKTLVFKWRALPMAIELAILGMHFAKVARSQSGVSHHD